MADSLIADGVHNVYTKVLTKSVYGIISLEGLYTLSGVTRNINLVKQKPYPLFDFNVWLNPTDGVLIYASLGGKSVGLFNDVGFTADSATNVSFTATYLTNQ